MLKDNDIQAVERLHEAYHQITRELARVIVAQDEVIEQIIKKGIYVVPTLTAGAHIIAKGTEGGVPEWAVEKARAKSPLS